MRLPIPLLILISLLGSCVAAPSAPPVPPTRVPVVAPAAPPPAPVPVANRGDWRDWPLTPGDWVYRQDARGSIALFGRPGADAEVTLRCDRQAGTLYLSRRGAATAASSMMIRTTSTVRALAVRPTGGTPPYLAIALAVRDPIIDAIGFSRGRFVIEQPGLPTLVVPAWAEILRVAEDCRG